MFYEVGYAHALGKPAILLTQKTEDIPFDLKHYSHVIYEDNIVLLKAELKKGVKHAINHPDRKTEVIPYDLTFYINGVPVDDGTQINVQVKYFPGSTWYLRVDVQNASDHSLDMSTMERGFVFPASLGKPGGSMRTDVQFPGNRYMCRFTELPRLLPRSWYRFSPGINSSTENEGPTAFECSILTFTEIGIREIKFTLWARLIKDEEEIPF